MTLRTHSLLLNDFLCIQVTLSTVYVYIHTARTHIRTHDQACILTFFERKKQPQPQGFMALNCGARPSLTPALLILSVSLYVYVESQAYLLHVISKVIIIFIAADAAYLIVYIFYRYIHVRLAFYYTYFEITFLTYLFDKFDNITNFQFSNWSQQWGGGVCQ
jgi:hypothetical protein